MYEVKPSAIHGMGVFARKPIIAGTVIGELNGQVTREDGPHVLWITDELGMQVTCELRYINHSPKPTAAYMDDATVVALRNIEPGEEITHDYSGEGLEFDVE